MPGMAGEPKSFAFPGQKGADRDFRRYAAYSAGVIVRGDGAIAGARRAPDCDASGPPMPWGHAFPDRLKRRNGMVITDTFGARAAPPSYRAAWQRAHPCRCPDIFGYPRKRRRPSWL